MEVTFEELKGMNVAQMREVAAQIEGFTGYTQMRKDKLLEAICEQLNIDMHVHHEVVGVNKTAIKKQIRELKARRDECLVSRDHEGLKRARRDIHRLKRKLHRATV